MSAQGRAAVRAPRRLLAMVQTSDAAFRQINQGRETVIERYQPVFSEGAIGTCAHSQDDRYYDDTKVT